jgi:hypothetical protein
MVEELEFMAGARDFSLLNSVQIGHEAHTASYPLFLGGKAAGA